MINLEIYTRIMLLIFSSQLNITLTAHLGNKIIIIINKKSTKIKKGC